MDPYKEKQKQNLTTGNESFTEAEIQNLLTGLEGKRLQ